MKKYSLLLLLLTTLFLLEGQAQITYITPAGAGLHDGSSWSNAYAGSSLRSVLSSLPSGSEVWVAAGTYKPAVSGRDSSFEINTGLKVYGGFAGTETTLAARNWTLNVTTLSGEIGDPATDTDNTNHIVHFYSAYPDAQLDGFVIERGHAIDDGATAWSGYGGGILNEADSSNPIIRNCIFRNNYADKGGSAYADVITAGGLRSLITNCSFFDNNCVNLYSEGGGSIIMNNTAMTPTANIYSTIDSCFISGGLNGGILCRANGGKCSPTVSNCTIQHVQGVALNTVGYLWFYPASINAVYRNCHVSHNHDTFFGSAVQFFASMGSLDGHLLIDGCVIDSNTSGIHIAIDSTVGGSAKIINTKLTDNADTGFGNSSEIYFQTGSGCTDSLDVENCVIFNRITGYIGSLPDIVIEGGGFRGHTYVNLNNTTLFKQQWPLASFLNAQLILQMYTASAATNSIDLNVENSIIYCNDTEYYDVYSTFGPTATMHVTSHNSILSKSRGSGMTWRALGTDGGGNMMVYPIFRDTASKDLHIACHSPAINHGSNSYVPSFLTTDYDGTPRIKNSIVDIGAYELDSTTCTTLSMGGVSANGLVVSPNPAHDVLMLECDGLPGGEAKATIFDIAGKQVKQQMIKEAVTAIRVDDLTPGLYLIKTEINDQIKVSKFVVTR